MAYYTHYNEDIIDVDLSTGTIHRSFVNHIIGEGDAKGNRYGARIFRNGEPVSLSMCPIIGYFIRGDGTTVVIEGVATQGNVCYVTLPAACYAVEGQFTLSIKVTGGGVVGTMRIVDGTVVNTAEGTLVDPGSVIPELSDYETLISQAEGLVEDLSEFVIENEQIAGTRYRIKVTTPSD